jgi:prepilin peptidase CpaA
MANLPGTSVLNEISIIAAVPLLSLLGAATLIDWRSRTIPNALSLGGAALGLIVQLTLAGTPGLLAGIAGFAVCMVCFLPFYVSGGMAAGDVKLMAAVGVFLGPLGGFVACIGTLIVGAVLGMICLGYESLNRLRAGQAAEVHAGLRARIPYAGAIATGTSVVLVLAALGVTPGVFA